MENNEQALEEFNKWVAGKDSHLSAHIQTIRQALQAQSERAVDVDGMKMAKVDKVSDNGIPEYWHVKGWNDCIDHLSENNHLRTSAPQVQTGSNCTREQNVVDVEEIKRKALNEILKGRDIRHKDVVFDIVSEAVNHIKHFGYLRTQDSTKPEGIEGLDEVLKRTEIRCTYPINIDGEKINMRVLIEAAKAYKALCDTEGDGDELER